MKEIVQQILALFPDLLKALVIGFFLDAALYVLYYKYWGVSLSAQSLVGLYVLITLFVCVGLRLEEEDTFRPMLAEV